MSDNKLKKCLDEVKKMPKDEVKKQFKKKETNGKNRFIRSQMGRFGVCR